MECREMVPVMVVRIPVMSREAKDQLRAELEASILEGLLLLEDGQCYEVAELPLPRGYAPLLQEDPPPPPPSGRNGSEKRRIWERLQQYRRKHGLGSFAFLANACGADVTETTLRNLYSGDEAAPIQVWRQIGVGLDKLGVSDSDTRKGEKDGKEKP